MDLVRLFCDIDDFCQQFEPAWHSQSLAASGQKRSKPSKLCLSEVMTITVVFHLSGYRTFKHYYLNKVCKSWRREFPALLSCNRFVELMAQALVPLCI